MKYIHLNEVDCETRVPGGPKEDRIRVKRHVVMLFGHTNEENRRSETNLTAKSNESMDFWRARRGSNSRPDDSKSSKGKKSKT